MDVHGESIESTHGWKRSDRNYRWIDDVLTSSTVRLEEATLRRTDPDVYPQAMPSDHNGIVLEGKY